MRIAGVGGVTDGDTDREGFSVPVDVPRQAGVEVRNGLVDIGAGKGGLEGHREFVAAEPGGRADAGNLLQPV